MALPEFLEVITESKETGEFSKNGIIFWKRENISRTKLMNNMGVKLFKLLLIVFLCASCEI